MALFPKIESRCPYKGDISSVMDGDVCRLCKREVFDLTAMSDGERVAFMKGCSGEVCVSYRMPAIAAMALAAAAVALPTAAAAADQEIVIVTGGIHDPQNARYVQVPDGKPAPALPVVYEPKPVSSKAPS